VTALQSTLRLESYRDALRRAVDSLPGAAGHLREALEKDTAVVPADWESNQWFAAVGAVRLAYEVGVRENPDAVMADIERVLELDADEAEQLRAVIAPNAAADLRIKGVRERDGYLPNLLGMDTALDLRLITTTDEEDAVAPIVTVRFDFDEAVASSSSIVFQAPTVSLPALIEDLETLLRNVKRIQANENYNIPQWARLVDDGDEKATDDA
jgi:hypothetical protein